MTFNELPDYCAVMPFNCTGCRYKALCKRYYNKYKCFPYYNAHLSEEEYENLDTPTALGKGLEDIQNTEVPLTTLPIESKTRYMLRHQGSTVYIKLTQHEYDTILWFKNLIKANYAELIPFDGDTFKEVGDV